MDRNIRFNVNKEIRETLKTEFKDRTFRLKEGDPVRVADKQVHAVRAQLPP